MTHDNETVAKEAIRMTLRMFSEEVAKQAEDAANNLKGSGIPADVALRAFANATRELAIKLWGKEAAA
jgi:hypothetical protein